MTIRQITSRLVPALLLFTFVSIAHGQPVSWDDGGATMTWSNVLNWSPNGMPGAGNDVLIGDLANAASDDTIMNQDFSIRSLSLSNFTSVDTSGNQLTIGSGGLNLGLGTAFNVVPVAGGGNGLVTTGITVDNLAAFRLVDGQVRVGGSVTTNLGGTFTGYGSLTFNNGLGSPTIIFTNNGSLTTGRKTGSAASQRYTLNIGATDTDARIDLDGTSNNRVVNIVEQTTLELGMRAEDFFGTMTLKGGSIFDPDAGWRTGNGSLVDIDADTTSAGVADESIVRGALWSALNGSQVNVNSGTLVLDTPLVASTGSNISVMDNSGIQFNASTAIDGSLFLGDNSQLTVNGTTTINDPSINLDGSGSDGTVTVNNGAHLIVNSNQINGFNNDFTGTMEVNAGALEMNTAGAWNLIGDLNMNDNDGGIEASIVDGETLRVVGGTIHADGNLNRIAADAEFFSGSSATVVEDGASLIFAGETTFHGGSTHTGSGRLAIYGETNRPVIFNGATTINMPNGIVSLDSGSSSVRTHQLNDDVTINASSVEAFGNATPGATTDRININNSLTTLTVNLTDPESEWTIGDDGEVNIAAPGTLATSIAGSDLNIQGAANIDGLTRFTARVDLEQGGLINLMGSSILHMNGGTQADPNRIEGGLIAGGGGALHAFNTGLHGFGSVSPEINFLGGSDLIADGGTLTIQGDISVADIVGATSDSTLNLTLQLDTSKITALELTGGSTVGSTIQNFGTTRGHGSIKSAGFVNSGQLIASGGGQLTVDTVLAPDLDGSSGTPLIHALSSDLVIADPLADAFDGDAVVENGFALEFQQGWTLGTSGRLFMEGFNTSGAHLRGGQATLNGEVNIERIARFEAPVTFRPSGRFNLPDNNDALVVSANSTIQPGATFTGDGDLLNSSGARMSLTDGLEIGVNLFNSGEVAFIGVPGSIVDIQDYQQSSTGTTTFRLAGDAPGDYDQIIANEDVILDGELAVDLLSGFLPSLDDAFVLLQATTGFVTGQFASQDLPGLSGNLTWQVDYSDPLTVWLRVVSGTISGDFDGDGDYACNDVDSLVAEIAAGTNDTAFDLTGDGSVNNVDLTAWLAEAGAAELVSGSPYLPGDANLDGTVDGPDFLAWNTNKFTSDNGWCGGDFNADGITDGPDFLIWNANKFTSADSQLSSVPEPGTWAMLLLAVLGGLYPTRNRK